jgi:hypothetical protein
VVVSLALGGVLWLTLGSIPTPLPDTQTWSLRDMSARTLIPCPEVPRAPWTSWLAPLLPAAGLVVVGGLVCGAMAGASRRAGPGAPGTGTMVVTFGLLQLAIANALWLYNDRYYVVFAPAILYVATAMVPMRARIGVPLLVLWGIVSITGVRDALAFNETVATAVERLEKSGVPPAAIDAGWSSNGWRLYAHPERLPPGASRDSDVPFVNSAAASPYAIANCVVPGYEVRSTIPLRQATWQGTDMLYVLRRPAAP